MFFSLQLKSSTSCFLLGLFVDLHHGHQHYHGNWAFTPPLFKYTVYLLNIVGWGNLFFECRVLLTGYWRVYYGSLEVLLLPFKVIKRVILSSHQTCFERQVFMQSQGASGSTAAHLKLEALHVFLMLKMYLMWT